MPKDGAAVDSYCKYCKSDATQVFTGETFFSAGYWRCLGCGKRKLE